MRDSASCVVLTLLLLGCQGDVGLPSGNADDWLSNDASAPYDQEDDREDRQDAGSDRPEALPNAGNRADDEWPGSDDADDMSDGNESDRSLEALPSCVRTLSVGTRAQLDRALDDVKAGDCLELKDGEHTFPRVSARGTAERPIVIRAKTRLKARVKSGNLELSGAQHVTVEGLTFQSSGSIKINDCDHCRISRFRIQRKETDQEVDWITVSGTSQHTRIDHNELGPQNRIGNMVMLAGKGGQVVQHTRIDHNYFHDVNYSGGNGWEIIRAGLSGYTFSSGHTVIEHNLFVRADSDPETISVKSSDNVIRYNTMRETAGQFTLRHGNRTSVYGNFILGDGVQGSAGIRVYGGEHKIYNNYIADVEDLAINVDGGQSDDDSGELTDHKVSYGVQVLFNTIVSRHGIGLGSGKPLKPRDCVIANNLIKGSGKNLSLTTGARNTKLAANVVQGGSVSTNTGVLKLDPKLEKDGDTWRISSSSAAVDRGTSDYAFVSEDIAGKPRAKPDIGAHEVSAEAPKYRLLVEQDVGPSAP